MNKLQVATVALSVPLILFVAGGTASASPGSGPIRPEWVPEWLYVPYAFIWNIGYLIQNGLNPFTGAPW